MSTKVKERLKKLMLELDHEGRTFFDRAIEHVSGKTCDEAIELMPDEKVREIVIKIKEKQKKSKKKKKRKEILVEA